MSPPWTRGDRILTLVGHVRDVGMLELGPQIAAHAGEVHGRAPVPAARVTPDDDRAERRGPGGERQGVARLGGLERLLEQRGLDGLLLVTHDLTEPGRGGKQRSGGLRGRLGEDCQHEPPLRLVGARDDRRGHRGPAAGVELEATSSPRRPVAAPAAARTLEPVDAEIKAAVAAEEPAMVALLAELVAAPTLLGREAPGQEIMRRAFVELGLEPFQVPLDRAVLDGHPSAAPFNREVKGKANVLADWQPAHRAGPPDGRSLILNGHIDVVSPEPASLWSGEPFSPRREGEWLYGRGAGDMKSGLAAMVGAVRGLRRLGVTPRARVQLQSVVEEECTGNGALACVLAGHTADAAILTEPTQGAVWTAQVGVLWFAVRMLGAPAHAADAREGANAIEASFAVVDALRSLETELNVVRPRLYADHPHPINLNVGTIRGGDWPSTVAGECLTQLRLAAFPGEPIADLKERVERTVAGSPRAAPS
jgi:acetylornithine deacetylase